MKISYFLTGIWSLLSLTASMSPVLALTQLGSAFNAGDLIKGSGSTVYYFAQDGRRYVFPNERTYFTWYRDFSSVKSIPDTHLAAIPLGRSNVTYRPGYKMLKITTDPRTYVVDRGGVLRHVTSASLANTLYGLNWNDRIDDISDAFFTNYRLGTPIQTASDYRPNDVMTLTPDIADDKSMDKEQVTITISSHTNGFVPTTFTVKRGTTVTWTNRDINEHIVRGNGWTSASLRAEQSWSRVFSQTGSFDYSCGIHSTMQGTINVVP